MIDSIDCFSCRVVLVSAVSPTACSRRPKAASPATAAPPTGPTEECFPLPPSQKAVCVRAHVCKPKTNKKTILGFLAPSRLPPPLQVLIKSFGFSLPPFSKLVVHVRYLCMYLYKYIYTVYVIVEHEMWLLHFIFEGLLFTFFKTAGKDVTFRQNEMMIMRVREQVEKDLKLM